MILDGAGVDIFTEDFWVQSLPDNQNGWTVVPTGRTSWVAASSPECFSFLLTISTGLGLAWI